eukprot:CAMPEP_0182423306 /NCGR_PEP_ID=MMETSP1167-20130531/9262_1 /TAXON_ID=2988 /ORGANISM="Mallomonas Sp, Strain CCMP3275" /LENGTH=531 /DNA_ID=CAMNT_0024602151 /DNA_START=199 /DNA_END=1794 /DNA_ORIENTATION=+
MTAMTNKDHKIACLIAAKNMLISERINADHSSSLRNKTIFDEYSALLNQPTEVMSFQEKMMLLRKLVLKKGIPDDIDNFSEENRINNKPSIRIVVWKLLLGAYHVDAAHYIALIKEGPTAADQKIRNDTFRTFKGDQDFWNHVTEAKMSRVLNAFVRNYFQPNIQKTSMNNEQDWKEDIQSDTNENKEESGHKWSLSHIGYVQGMNILVAPFLYVMPELDAFASFSQLIMKHCPRYVLRNLEGTHRGCYLVGRCLEVLDSELYEHITQKMRIQADLFAFPIVMTLFASVRPFHEVLKVWDALFAFGVHFNIILCAVHIMLIREKLLAEDSAYRLQREIRENPLDAELLITCGLKMCRFISEELFELLVTHPVEDIKENNNMKKPVTNRPRSTSGLAASSVRSDSPVSVRSSDVSRDIQAQLLLQNKEKSSHAPDTCAMRPDGKTSLSKNPVLSTSQKDVLRNKTKSSQTTGEASKRTRGVSQTHTPAHRSHSTDRQIKPIKAENTIKPIWNSSTVYRPQSSNTGISKAKDI